MVRTFIERTGMTCFEHDGSYSGDVCASTSHTHHKGLKDSQWKQFDKIAELYNWMCAEGIYINVPDYYILNGSTKVAIGYREVNWSLPRERQLIHTRQLNYRCTWERIPSSLWSFVPLVEYFGGGEAATLEPLKDHLAEYRALMFQNYGAGIQACYRGPRLYDSEMIRTIKVPLYYSGLEKTASVREQEGRAKKYTLDRDWCVTLGVRIPANGYTWYVFE